MEHSTIENVKIFIHATSTANKSKFTNIIIHIIQIATFYLCCGCDKTSTFYRNCPVSFGIRVRLSAFESMFWIILWTVHGLPSFTYQKSVRVTLHADPCSVDGRHSDPVLPPRVQHVNLQTVGPAVYCPVKKRLAVWLHTPHLPGTHRHTCSLS